MKPLFAALAIVSPFALMTPAPTPAPRVIVDPVDNTRNEANADLCVGRVKHWLKLDKTLTIHIARRELRSCYVGTLPDV